MARTHAYVALVFAELLRAFGARSETRPLWRMNHLSNLNLLVVVSISFGIQVWSHHNAMLAGFLKTSLMPFSDCLMLLSVSIIHCWFWRASNGCAAPHIEKTHSLEWLLLKTARSRLQASKLAPSCTGGFCIAPL